MKTFLTNEPACRIQAEDWDTAQIKLLYLMATLQVPPTTEIIGELEEELGIDSGGKV